MSNDLSFAFFVSNGEMTVLEIEMKFVCEKIF